jgi:hypothetical protein
MLIRSQDKKSLINMDNVTDLSVVSGSEIMACYTTDQGYQRIGKYSDESKAIKVLDMIQDTYTPSAGEVQAYIDGAIPKVVLDNRVFQMPQDEEV